MAAPALLQLIYVSTATCPFEQDDLRELVGRAAAANLQDRITGLQLYNGRNFLQLIEGESGRINALMIRLRADPRHDGIKILFRQHVASPACGAWGMRLVPLDCGVAQRKAELDAVLPNTLRREARELIVNFAALT